MKELTMEELKKRDLDKCYAALYCTTVDVKITNEREIGKSKQAYVLYGCNLSGRRRYITTVLEDTVEKASNWYELFLQIKNRKLEKIVYGIIPDKKELKDGLKLAFPDIEIHEANDGIIRRFQQLGLSSDKEKTFTEIKGLYLANTVEEYESKLKIFCEKYESTPFIMDCIGNDLKNLEKIYKKSLKIRKLMFPVFLLRTINDKFSKVSRRGSYRDADEFVSELVEDIRVSEKKYVLFEDRMVGSNEWIIRAKKGFNKALYKCIIKEE